MNLELFIFPFVEICDFEQSYIFLRIWQTLVLEYFHGGGYSNDRVRCRGSRSHKAADMALGLCTNGQSKPVTCAFPSHVKRPCLTPGKRGTDFQCVAKKSSKVVRMEICENNRQYSTTEHT